MDEQGWRVERRIPLAVAAALAMQIGGALAWAVQLDARVGNIEQQSISSSSLNEKFARLEERLENMKQDITSVKRQLEQLTGRLIGQ